jgi:transcriptional regulator with XRE-family HTH domain
MSGPMVRHHRQRLCMTQEELAQVTGLSVRSIRDIESGRVSEPRPSTVRLLAAALELRGAALEEFLRTTDVPATPTAPDPEPNQLGTRPAQLPPATAAFTGRINELASLDSILDRKDRSPAVCALFGTAGVGKTALALHWAHRSANRFPDGQLFINLSGSDPVRPAMTPVQALRVLLDALHLSREQRPADFTAQIGLYRSLLARRRMLVILDDAASADQVRPLLPGAPNCLVLVTSRSCLYGLVATEGAQVVPVDQLSMREACDLLVRRLGAERVADEPAAVEQLSSSCARLPLALSIAAARAAVRPQLSLATLAAELGDPSTALRILSTGDPTTDLRTVFSGSYQALDQPTARLFRLFGSVPGDEVTVADAADLAGLPVDQVRPLLARLVDAHLLIERGQDQFHVHALLRAYAAELAGADSEPRQRERRFRFVDYQPADNGFYLQDVV